jgi:uncharacterized protein
LFGIREFSIPFVTILVFFAFVTLAFAQTEPFSINNSPLPAPTGMVNDYANIIDEATQAQIEKKLRDFKASTNPQVEIAVVTVRTTGERPIFDYTLAVARGWKIGSKEDDNPSALLLVAVDDRKYYTQVSKDLEDELTDGMIGSLQRQYLVPAFKQTNYGKGINDTVDAYIETIKKRASEPTATPLGEEKSETSGLGFFCCVGIVILVIFVLIIIFGSAGKGGGGTGSGGGDQDRWRSGGFGGNTSNNSSPIIFWGGGGDSSSSDWGSSSGGGDSWGGFGGGGDFGGGGSGGDW